MSRLTGAPICALVNKSGPFDIRGCASIVWYRLETAAKPAGEFVIMPSAHCEPARLKSMQYAIVLAFGALTLPSVGIQAQTKAPVDGPAGYEIACSLHSSPGFRACNELPSARSCDGEANYASRPSNEATCMTFVNRSDEPIKIYWLNFQGERISYRYLPPGARHTQQTFIGHNWLVTTLAEQCIGIFKGAPQSIAFF
jgi:hypothetical protein